MSSSSAVRMLSPKQTAQYIGRSRSWLYANLDRLIREGFPKPDPLLGNFDRQAIDAWLDHRAETTSNSVDAALAAGLDSEFGVE
jgi:predicted DNA-binding transcriptional regulator AlpA